jgi:ABC-2 type transport system permease protein
MYFLLKWLLRAWRRRRAGSGPPQARSVGNAPVPAPERRMPSPASRGMVALLSHQVRYDMIVTLRNPRARFFTFFFPIVLLVILAGVFGHQHTVIDGARVKLDRFYVPGILAMSLVVASYGNLVISISNLRETGVLKRRRATPVEPALLIAGQAAATLVTVVSMSAILLIVGWLAYGIGFSAGALAALACTVVVGTLACACIGYAVSGLIGNPDAAQPIVQASTLPLWFISGVFIPNSNLNATLRHIADVFPVEHLTSSFQHAALRGSFSAAISGTDLLVLAAWGVAALVLAAYRFSWLPSAATA